MHPSRLVTEDIFSAYLRCQYKAYLRLRGEEGEPSDYQKTQARLSAEYKAAAREGLLRRYAGQDVVQGPRSLQDAFLSSPALILDATAGDGTASCHVDALEKDDAGPAPSYRPVLFAHREKASTDDRMMLGFAASLLERVQGHAPRFGRIVHGRDFRPRRVELPSLAGPVRAVVGQLERLAQEEKPPRLMLNRHCGDCEFRKRCRAEATARDDLSLLAGLSPAEITALNGRGIFTVTQFSHTFRPGRMKKAGARHDQSLQALALRENTIYVAKRPELPSAVAELFLDVEGLPETGFYYLVGLTVCRGGSRRHLSFWADDEGDEASMWAAFLAAVAPLEGFVLFHYGSYEADFLAAMKARPDGTHKKKKRRALGEFGRQGSQARFLPGPTLPLVSGEPFLAAATMPRKANEHKGMH